MGIIGNAVEEAKQNPITVTTAVAMLLVTVVTSLPAWFAPTIREIPASISHNTSTESFSLRNLSIVLSFFLASNFSAALMLRFLSRLNSFMAAILSVPGIVLVAFSSLVGLNLIPPKLLSGSQHTAVADSVFYGSIFIFISVNGLPVLRSIIEPWKLPDNSDESKRDSFYNILAILLTFGIWGLIVKNGLDRLVIAFFS